MKKILSVLISGLLVACTCNENQWEEVEVVTFDETVYEEPVELKGDVLVEPKPIYVQAPQQVQDCPCVEQAPCQVAYQPCCQCAPTSPQPKVTTTKKIITTTTTLEEPCGKEVCEPVVTVHEEIISSDDEVKASPVAPVVVNPEPVLEEEVQVEAPIEVNPNQEYVKVTVKKNPYRSEVVNMQKTNSNVQPKQMVNYSPEAYTVVATRATNRMLQDTTAIYENGVKRVYIKDTKLLSSDLPYGSHRVKGATRDIIAGSKIYDIVNNIKNADLVIEPSLDWFVSSNSQVPALQYKMTLLDKNGKKIDEWIEVIRQVKE